MIWFSFRLNYPRKDFLPWNSRKSPKGVKCDGECSVLLLGPSYVRSFLKQSLYKAQPAQGKGWVYSQKIIKIKCNNNPSVLKERIKCTDTSLHSRRWYTDTSILEFGQTEENTKAVQRGEIKKRKSKEESVLLQKKWSLFKCSLYARLAYKWAVSSCFSHIALNSPEEIKCFFFRQMPSHIFSPWNLESLHRYTHTEIEADVIRKRTFMSVRGSPAVTPQCASTCSATAVPWGQKDATAEVGRCSGGYTAWLLLRAASFLLLSISRLYTIMGSFLNVLFTMPEGVLYFLPSETGGCKLLSFITQGWN